MKNLLVGCQSPVYRNTLLKCCGLKTTGGSNPPPTANFMMCFQCDNEDEFDLKPDADIEQEYKGHTLWIKTPVMVCRKCGWQMLADGQLDLLLKATKKAYEEKVTKENGPRGS